MISEKKKYERSVKLYPWYYGLSADLILYVAINTIWLIEVKGYSDVQMNLLSSVASLTALALIYPMLRLTKKIGNVVSMRIGAFCLFLSSLIFTFSNSYLIFVIGELFYELSFLFAMMSIIVIKNNLEKLGREGEFVKVRSDGSLIYAILTAIATLCCGYLFNFHKFLPMILGTVLCLVCFFISLFIVDVDNVKKEEVQTEKKNKSFMRDQFKIIIAVILYYGLAFSIIAFSQQNGKLLIQNTLLEGFSVEKTAIYLSYVMFISRIVRILGNMAFPLVYRKLGNKTGILVSFMIFLSCLIILVGAFIKADIYLRAIIISFGFSFIPLLRDPLRIISQNLIFEKIDKKYHEDALAYLTLGRNIFKFAISLVVSAFLLNFSVGHLFIMLVLFSLPVFVIIFKIIGVKGDV